MIRQIFTLLLPMFALAACQTVQPQPQQAGFTPQQVAALQQQGFEPAGDDWQFGMADRLLFATDESTLIPDQQAAISRISRVLAAVGIRGARVEGHTDSTGSASYNEALSARRAQAVADALVNGGMARQAMRVIGMGSRVPVESNHLVSGRRENRRVVIIVSPADAGD
ncbi:OOP family OmpA-OmpF porin [Sphingobium wenxiniae]|uniref:OOP family OmpA-OmpF porin n=1 Tax=Sphingobium wenxiniae (strain DSM 21828 / CGMCC 1.7748 / JZ-1) TaxID=595605 RepID=A0A562KD35_SPHWJ|nr:OmpA family protein [Sphingobium wenxiniae]MBB6191366.1 OOP family OmpA-OmpF porin [Sphingobium wenxiniae]TWH93339.1 OOP family OmpA-OmpF porin [Sphingobium wenxiniae]